jgi:hypothetical protein
MLRPISRSRQVVQLIVSMTDTVSVRIDGDIAKHALDTPAQQCSSRQMICSMASGCGKPCNLFLMFNIYIVNIGRRITTTVHKSCTNYTLQTQCSKSFAAAFKMLYSI